MLIAISGTPGTGKTTIAKILHQKYDYKFLNIHDFAKHENLIYDYDETRNSDIIDVEKLDEKIQKLYSSDELIILDGHVTHELECIEYVIVLRCNPVELKERLKNKKWKESKIKENIEAEIMDVILCESVSAHNENKVFEIDTTNIKPLDIAKEIHKLISKNFLDEKKYKPGKIDWTDMIFTDNMK